MANDVSDGALHRKSIFMSVWNVRCVLILDSFHFRPLLDNCESHHLLSAASWLMRPDHLSWDAALSIHVAKLAIKPPTFHASWVLLKITVIKGKMLFPQLLRTSIKVALCTGATHLALEVFHLSVLCIPWVFATKKEGKAFVISLMLCSVLIPVWLCLITDNYSFPIFDPFTGQFLLFPDLFHQ